ncbi:MAG TPA: hypothetical protein VN376_06510 [Longilinea sp.]|nr:hypothetical protein [Longilinea sp.]
MKKIITTILCLAFLSSCGLAPVETPTETTSPSITPSVTAYITPAVTPDPDQPVLAAMARIDELNMTNGGCTYPCFWGITPGVTTLAEARSIIEPIVYSVPEDLDAWHSGTWEIYPYDNRTGAAARFADLELVISADVIQEIYYDPGTLAIWDVLDALGQPEEILYSFSTLNYPLFSPTCDLLLLYPSRGIVAHLLFASGIDAQVNGENVNAWLDEWLMLSEVSEYLFFAPGSDFSQSEYIEALLLGNTPYVNIRDGMGMTPEEFVERFGDHQLDATLEFTDR